MSFPLSNWTELDVWHTFTNNIEIVPLYFSKERPVVNFDGIDILVDDDRMPIRDDQKIELKSVRFNFRCYPLTGAVNQCNNSARDNSRDASTKSSERQGRLIDADRRSYGRKKQWLISSHYVSSIRFNLNDIKATCTTRT